MEKQLGNPVKNSVKKRPTTVTTVMQCSMTKGFTKGEKTQQDHKVMESFSNESKAQKDWPEKASKWTKTNPKNQL